jgi:outer membrane lipoprotein-sorting protein
MSGRNDINRRLRDLRFKVDPQTHDRILSDALRAHADARRAAPLWPTIIRRFVMTRWLLKLSLAGIVVVVAVAVFSQLGGGVALADVLKHIQQSSYSFDLTIRFGNAYKTVCGSVLQQGRARFDDEVGGGDVSTIVDLASRKSLVLFHKFQTARFMEPPEEPGNTAADIAASDELGNTGADKLLLLCSRPMEELWRLRDGTEEDLGEKTIDGVQARGFRVVHEDEYFRNEITLWAKVRSGLPLTVEIASTALKPPGDELVFTLEDFVVDPEMDESLFSLEVPPGHTLAEQTTLADIEFAGESSDEAKKIAATLRLWAEGQKDRAIETLLDVNWVAPITFAKVPYVFALTEQNIVELKQDEQQRVMAPVMGSCKFIRQICFELVERSNTARSAEEYATAETHLEAGLQLGELLNRDPEGIVIAQLVGIAARKLTLVQLKELYEEIDAPEKLVATEQEIQEVDAAHQALVGRLRRR